MKRKLIAWLKRADFYLWASLAISAIALGGVLAYRLINAKVVRLGSLVFDSKAVREADRKGLIFSEHGKRLYSSACRVDDQAFITLMPGGLVGNLEGEAYSGITDIEIVTTHRGGQTCYMAVAFSDVPFTFANFKDVAKVRADFTNIYFDRVFHVTEKEAPGMSKYPYFCIYNLKTAQRTTPEIAYITIDTLSFTFAS